jgi:hypothetical protein
MIIIEILLTIFAWRKGWRWFSLIPIATAFFNRVNVWIFWS